ncbi:MAG TPA: hypothetical protein VJ719_07290 [Chthoniobacterales bacterium]|nr:hypothetical protein [Chthoniobacterales bacterium]
MNAIELTRALERGDHSNASFHHSSHLAVAWVYLQGSDSLATATEKMRATLRKFATAAGKAEKYHETITVFWMRTLAALRDTTPGCDLDQILAANPRLLEKDFPLDYYSHGLLFSDRARTSWVEPDRKPLSSNATSIHSPGSASNASHRVACR